MIPLFSFNVTRFHVKNDFLRVVYFVGFCLGVLAITVGLASASNPFTGQYTDIATETFEPSSVILKGDARITPKSTFAGLLEKPYQGFKVRIAIPAVRFASLAKGFLRGGVYGMAIDAAMTGAGWLWNEARREWEKVKINPPPAPQTGLGYCHGYGQAGATTGYGTGIRGLGCYTFPGGSGEQVNNCYTVFPTAMAPVMFDASCPAPGGTTDIETASPQDIFDDGVKKVSDAIPKIITGLPDVVKLPLEKLVPPAVVGVHWPEMVTYLNNLVNNFFNNYTLNEIVNKAFTDLSTLNQVDLDFLTQNNIDIQTLVDAINNTVNNVTLTTQQKNQLQIWNQLQNTVSPNPDVTVVPDPAVPLVPIDIPTDCELIPFVCDWLTWYRDWLTEDPPPIPEVAVPIEDLGDFDPWPTDTSGSCPSPYTFTVFGRSVQLSFQPWCDLAVLIAPLLMALGWLFATYIVLRVR